MLIYQALTSKQMQGKIASVCNQSYTLERPIYLQNLVQKIAQDPLFQREKLYNKSSILNQMTL